MIILYLILIWKLDLFISIKLKYQLQLLNELQNLILWQNENQN